MIPPFLDMTPHFVQYNSGIVDAGQAAIDAIRTALLAGGWTEPGAAYTLVSPAPASIRMTITFGRLDANTISFVAKDHVGRQINNDTLTKQIVANNSGCYLYFSDNYVYHEVFDNTTSMWCVAVLNRDPDPIDRPFPAYWASKGPLTNAGGTAYQTFGQGYLAASGVGSLRGGILSWTGVLTASPHFSGQGSMMFQPIEHADGDWFYGRMPNVLFCDSTQQPGTSFDVPLDEVTTGAFRVTRYSTACNLWIPCVRTA